MRDDTFSRCTKWNCDITPGFKIVHLGVQKNGAQELHNLLNPYGNVKLLQSDIT